MLYTPMTKKAMRICFAAHKDQVDKSDIPYVFHPIHLAEEMETEETITAALLHDVVEDTEITLDQLREEGFSPAVVEAVDLLTHRKGVSYYDYLAEISKNPIAREVKMADLRHNSDITRLDKPGPRDLERAMGYIDSMTTLRRLTRLLANEEIF